jgi:membrane protein DedA with SNARE-associated domain
MSHFLLAGMTTEVTNLVFLSSFLGITLAVVIGDIFFFLKGNSHGNRPLEPKV